LLTIPEDYLFRCCNVLLLYWPVFR
jgi:hypothetical protein